MNNYDDVHLLLKEKLSLFSFNFYKRKPKEKIKHFQSLYFTYRFLCPNYSDEKDQLGFIVEDGTFSISDNYLRYKIYLRKKRFANLPNWIAILLSLISLLISLATLL